MSPTGYPWIPQNKSASLVFGSAVWFSYSYHIYIYTIPLNLTLSDLWNKNSFCQIFGLFNHIQGIFFNSTKDYLNLSIYTFDLYIHLSFHPSINPTTMLQLFRLLIPLPSLGQKYASTIEIGPSLECHLTFFLGLI